MNPRVSVITPVRAREDEDVGWMLEAINSVKSQTYTDWEMYIVNDRSTVSLAALKPIVKGAPNIHAMSSKAPGVSSARNTGAESANGELLFALDHDDQLPADALEAMVNAWDEEGKDFGVVYGDVLSFGVDFERHMQLPKFAFPLLLQTLIIPVGALHAKSAWKEIGGWKDKYQGGLEEWVYWIDMCIHGYHGYHIPQVTYKYRRHARGRLAALRADQDKFAEQQALIKQEFLAYYNGKEPKMCKGCGGGRPRSIRGATASPRPAAPAQFSPDGVAIGRILVKYLGKRDGGFGVTGRATGWKYHVPGGNGCLVEGPDGKPGVHPNDVQFFRGYDGGSTFMVESA